MRCDIIAQGIIDASTGIACNLPIVVRMDGSRLIEGKNLLSQSGLNIETVDNLGDGAAKIVQRVIKKRKVPIEKQL